MSDLRVALVAEGFTDAIVIEAALKALLPRLFIPILLQPEEIGIENNGRRIEWGWAGVLDWCLQFLDYPARSAAGDPGE